MDKFRKFWMVLGAGTPCFQHPTEEAARTEAERLARSCPGNRFTVLEAIFRVEKSDVMWQEASEDDEIPF